MANREPAFLTKLKVEEVDDKRWVLVEDFAYWSVVAEKLIVVPKGFVTDFASVPRFPVIYLLAGGEADRPAVIHDYLYRTGVLERNITDSVFREAMLIDGQPAWRANLMWCGVRVFGSQYYHPKDGGMKDEVDLTSRVGP